MSVVKKGVYKLHRSVKWTEADNREIINELLRVYTEMIDVCKGGVKDGFTLEDVSDTEQIKSVKTFNACVATVDRLMKRGSLVHLGWIRTRNSLKPMLKPMRLRRSALIYKTR